MNLRHPRALKLTARMIAFVALIGGLLLPSAGLATYSLPAADGDPFGGAPGAAIFAAGNNLEVTMLGGLAAFDNDLYLEAYVTGGGDPVLIGTNREAPGSHKTISGHFKRGAELVFYIRAFDGSDANPANECWYSGWRSGSPARNIDSTAHAAVKFLGSYSAVVGFEDKTDMPRPTPAPAGSDCQVGSDWDFNDLMFEVSGVQPGGFVTGGGWIHPGGVRANYGFVAKYLGDDATPRGETEFQIPDGRNFHSTKYQYLVVDRPRFWLVGTGTIDRQGPYGFLMTATDLGVPSNQQSETFRIVIWKLTAPVPLANINGVGEILYDSNPAAGGDFHELPLTTILSAMPVSGAVPGNIVIHRK